MSRNNYSNFGGTATHRFPKGVSGNPGGRSSAAAELARRIRTALPGGDELIEFALAVLRGGWTQEQERDGRKPVPVDAKSRMYALEWLAERGWGKPKQEIVLSGDVSGEAFVIPNVKDLPLDKLREMAAGESPDLPPAPEDGDGTGHLH